MSQDEHLLKELEEARKKATALKEEKLNNEMSKPVEQSGENPPVSENIAPIVESVNNDTAKPESNEPPPVDPKQEEEMAKKIAEQMTQSVPPNMQSPAMSDSKVPPLPPTIPDSHPLSNKSVDQKITTDLLGVSVEETLYMVVTPQTNLEFYMAPMSLMHEEALKTSFVSRQMLTKMMAKVLFECASVKPPHIKTLDDFTRCVTLDDQAALLYGLYHTSYGELTNLTVGCPSCGQESQYDVPTANIMKYNPYMGDDFLQIRKEVDLTTGFKAVVRPVTVYDEMSWLDARVNLPNPDLDHISEYMLAVDYFIHPQGKRLDEILDKIALLTKMKSPDGRKIKKAFTEAFEDHKCEFKVPITCKNMSCGHKFEVEVELLAQFFRMVQLG